MESILISAKIGYVSLTLLSWFSKFKFTGELKKKKSLLLFTPHFPKVLSLEPSCIWFFLVLSKLSLLVILLSWSFSITNGSYLCIPKLTCLLTSKIICPTTLYYNFVFFIKFKCICCWLKKSQPKIMFYSVGFCRTSSLGNSISRNPEITALRRQGEEPGYKEVCNRGQVALTSKYSC